MEAGVDSLQVALEHLNAKGQDDFEAGHKVVTRRNLQMAIDGGTKLSPTEFLAHLLKQADAEIAAAKKHSQQGERRLVK